MKAISRKTVLNLKLRVILIKGGVLTDDKQIFSRREFGDLVGLSKEALADLQVKGLLVGYRKENGDYFYTREHFLTYSNGQLGYQDFQSGVYKLTEASRIIGITGRSLQRKDKEKSLVAYRTITDRRLYTRKQLEDFLGVDLDIVFKTSDLKKFSKKSAQKNDFRLAITGYLFKEGYRKKGRA